MNWGKDKIIIDPGAWGFTRGIPKPFRLTRKMRLRYRSSPRSDGMSLACWQEDFLVSTLYPDGTADINPGYEIDGATVFSPIRELVATRNRMPAIFIHDLWCDFCFDPLFVEFAGPRIHGDRLMLHSSRELKLNLFERMATPIIHSYVVAGGIIKGTRKKEGHHVFAFHATSDGENSPLA